MMKKRLRLDELSQEQRTELEQKYVHYVPDTGKVIYSKVCQCELHLETLPAPEGWHLVFPNGFPYLISHSNISFYCRPRGFDGWMYHEEENLKFLSTCYSNRTLGTEGCCFTVEKYEALSNWIKNSGYECNIFLADKVRNGIFYDIAVAVGSEIHYVHVADTAGNMYPASYSFRPTVKLFSHMYLFIDDEHDGSTPEKGMLLEPAVDYNPSEFRISTSIGTQEMTTEELFEFIDTLREFVKSPLYAKLKPILEALEKE